MLFLSRSRFHQLSACEANSLPSSQPGVTWLLKTERRVGAASTRLCVCRCRNPHMYACVQGYVCVYLGTHMYICARVDIHTCVCVSTCGHYVHMCVCEGTHVCTNTSTRFSSRCTSESDKFLFSPCPQSIRLPVKIKASLLGLKGVRRARVK